MVKQLGGKATPASGFAMGTERLLELIDFSNNAKNQNQLDIYLIVQGDSADAKGLKLAEQLRDKISGLSIMTNCGGGSFKSQMKKADKSNAAFALLLGEDEINQNAVTIKYLREKKEQKLIPMDDVAEFVKTNL